MTTKNTAVQRIYAPVPDGVVVPLHLTHGLVETRPQLLALIEENRGCARGNRNRNSSRLEQAASVCIVIQVGQQQQQQQRRCSTVQRLNVFLTHVRPSVVTFCVLMCVVSTLTGQMLASIGYTALCDVQSRSVQKSAFCRNHPYVLAQAQAWYSSSSKY